METKTAAIYARISQDKRKGTKDEGASVESQIAACKDWIERKGWTVGKVYRDTLSATKGGVRAGFEEMLKDAPKVVVYFKQDRLERDPKDLDRFILAGCEGYAIDGTRVTVDNASAELVSGLFSLLNRFEGKQKAERQKLRNKSDAEAGKWHYSRPIFGNDRVTGKIIPAEAEAIRHAAKLIAAEESTFFQTAKEWNALGFRTPESKGAGGRLWEPGTVRNFFTSPRLIGKRVYEGKTYVMSGWEPVLDEETFDTIQELINANKTGRRGVQGSRNMPHLLTGIATCDVCGKGLNAGYRGGKTNARSYRCTTPGHVSRVAEPFEKWVVEKFLYLLMHDGAEQVVSPDTHGSATKLRLERVKAVKAHGEWLDEAVEADLSPAIIAKKEKAHAAKLEELDAKLLEVMRETSFAGLLPELASDGPEAMWKRWESVSMEKKRAVVQSLFSEIVVKKAPQGKRFKPEYVRLKATDLMLELISLNQQPEAASEQLAEAFSLAPLDV